MIQGSITFQRSEDKMENPREWTPTIMRRALSSQVLVVAKTRIEGAWSAYCDAVPGISHEREQERVLLHGTKIPEEVARVLFPEFEDVPYNP